MGEYEQSRKIELQNDYIESLQLDKNEYLHKEPKDYIIEIACKIAPPRIHLAH